MKTALITVKMEPEIKEKAKQKASEIGLSLSSVVNGLIYSFIKTGKVNFGAESYEPSEYLIEAIKDAEEERKKGWVSPSFDNVEDSLKWLENPNRKYVRDLQ